MSARTIVRVAAASAMGAALVLGATPVTAQAAESSVTSAAACHSEAWGPYDGGYAFTVSGKKSPLRPAGPYSECGIYYVPANTEFSIDCRLYNDVGNLWYHGDVYVNGAYHTGWMFAGNLSLPYESNYAWC